MPKIFEYFGFIFYFYSNEHEPIHVHVMHGGKESVFDLIMMDGELSEVRVREKKGTEPLPEKDKRTAEEFICKYYTKTLTACQGSKGKRGMLASPFFLVAYQKRLSL